MSFFTSLKHAFGFGSTDYDEDDVEGIDARVTPLRERLDLPSGNENATGMPMPVAEAASCRQAQESLSKIGADESGADDSRHLTLGIFDGVLKVFNEALPDFLQKTVDGDAQREYLYNNLDNSTREYLERVEGDAMRRCNERWEQERRRLLMEMDELKRRATKEEEDSSEAKKQQLSAERQKRALSERVHDLEKQLASLEAENEQYMLENKSLVNKLRLTQVLGNEVLGDVEMGEKLMGMTAELDAARQELASLRHDKESSTLLLGKKDSDIAEIQSKLSERETELNNVNLSLERAVEEQKSLREEIEKLKVALEQSRVKDDIGDVMLSELNRKASEAVEESKAKARELEVVSEEKKRVEQKLHDAEQARELAVSEMNHSNSELAAVKEKYESVTGQYDALKKDYGEATARLKESLKSLEVVEEMNRQLELLEQARQSNEAYLRRQKDELMQKTEQLRQLELEKQEYSEAIKQKDEAIRRLEDISDSLRKTMENNVYEHAQAESALKSEIDRLKSMRKSRAETPVVESANVDVASDVDLGGTSFDITIGDVPNVKAHDSGRKRRGKKPGIRISAIDETLEDTDWLLATPPAAKGSEADAEVDTKDFGYKEPARKSAPDNPAQMSLW